jgi:hypothetical protein
MLGACTSRAVRLEWLVRETILNGRGNAMVAALREREWVESQRMVDARSAAVCYDARRNLVCISVFLQGAGVEPKPGLVSVALSGELIALLRRGLLRELACAAREVSRAVAHPGYERDAGRYRGPLGHQDSIRALLGLIGWENTGQEQEPVTVYLDRHRSALLTAAQNEHARQTRRAERSRTSWQRRSAAEAGRALLAGLIEAIGGEV